MGRFILLRLTAAVPVGFVVAFIIFGILFLAPGDPAATLAGDNASPEAIERIRNLMGLDRPFIVQFISWLGQITQGDLGRSLFDGRPVIGMIAERAAPTVSLMVLTILISIVIAVPLGIGAASKMHSPLDYSLSVLSTIGFSVPVYVVGYVLILLFSLKLGWLPAQGYVPLQQDPTRWFMSLVLPSLAMATSYIALIARITRSTVVDVLTQDYIRSARAKGLPAWRVTYVHAFRNAAIAVATVVGSGIAMLIGGAVVTESVFGIPGIGKLTIDAISKRDIPVIQGVVLIAGTMYIVINTVLDIVYKWLDPRINI
jgi:peptide/nickel transport system permease protein